METHAVARGVPVGFGRGRRTNRIALLQPNTSTWFTLPARIPLPAADQDLDPWLRTALCGFHVAIEAAGFSLLWHQWRKGQSAAEVAHEVFPHEADGAIILAPRQEHRELLSVLEEMEIPFVLAYAPGDSARHAWVTCDNRGGIARAVQHLASLGHERIGFLGGSTSVADFRERAEGFRQGMAEAGLPVDPSLMVEAGLREVISEVAPYAAMLLRRPDRPTALVCATDIMALAAIEVAWELGIKVPDHLAVVGFDDSDYAVRSIPALTTVHQPIIEIANRAAYLAACAITGQEPETGLWQMELPVALVVRESCGSSCDGRQLGVAVANHRMLRELEHHMRQLAATQAQMEELLYVASHDLRAPLITIEGFATMLQRKCGHQLDARGKDCVSRILRSVANLRELTDTLLAVSRAHRQPLSLRQVKVADVVARVLRDLEVPIAQRGVEVHVAERLPVVLADETALYQIFLNLVGNAVKFMGDQPQPRICLTHCLRGDEHQFTVQDNGIGIPPEHQDTIFQLFRRGPAPAGTEGQGVGLSLVKDLVLRHGGRIWVESEPGRGAAFHFTLPRESPAPPR